MSTYKSRCMGSETIAEGTQAFHFEKPADFLFQAGQAIDLVLPAAATRAEAAARHTFSLVSAPAESRLTIATRMRDSPYKRALASLPAGAGVDLEGPFGDLTLHDDRRRPACFIAGGIGITPFLSMLRQAAHEQMAQRFILIYSNRRPRDAPYLAELQRLAGQLADFRLLATMTRSDRADAAWSGLTGPIDGGLLASIASGQPTPIYYIAGPPQFTMAIQELLADSGVADDAIRSEDFYGY